MGIWDELEEGMGEFGKGLEIVALSGVAGGWLDRHWKEFKELAKSYELPPDEFLEHLLGCSFEIHSLLSLEVLRRLEEEVRKSKDKEEVANRHRRKDEKQAPSSWCEEHKNHTAACADKHKLSEDSADTPVDPTEWMRHDHRRHGDDGKGMYGGLR